MDKLNMWANTFKWEECPIVLTESERNDLINDGIVIAYGQDGGGIIFDGSIQGIGDLNGLLSQMYIRDGKVITKKDENYKQDYQNAINQNKLIYVSKSATDYNYTKIHIPVKHKSFEFIQTDGAEINSQGAFFYLKDLEL